MLDRLSNPKQKPVQVPAEKIFSRKYSAPIPYLEPEPEPEPEPKPELRPRPAERPIDVPQPTPVEEFLKTPAKLLSPSRSRSPSPRPEPSLAPSRPKPIPVIESPEPKRASRPVPSPFCSPRKPTPGDLDFEVNERDAMGKQDPNHLKPTRYQNGSTSLGARPKPGMNLMPSPIPSRHRVSRMFIFKACFFSRALVVKLRFIDVGISNRALQNMLNYFSFHEQAKLTDYMFYCTNHM